MENTEIRWHGRGGQGAKTAAVLLADLGVSLGLHVQAFPEYGPERMGAPVTAYNRLSQEPIVIHTPIDEPDVVVILDDGFIETSDVTEGLKEKGVVLVNSGEEPQALRERLKVGPGVKVLTIDANRISRESIGREIPNTPMVAAVVRAIGLTDEERLMAELKSRLEKKFRNQPKTVDGNLEALSRAYREAVSA